MKSKRLMKGTRVLVCLLVSLQVFTYSSISFAAPNELNDIDAGIANLNYDRNEVLSTKGDQINSFVPKEGCQVKDKFIVVERIKNTIATSPMDISIVDSIANRTYPGAIQLANEDFVNNQPNLVMTARKPLDISIDLPGLKSENTITVQNPSYSGVSGAVAQLLSTWVEKYSSTHTLPARLQYSEAMVHSESQIASALNVNAKVLDNTLGIDYNAAASGEKKVMVAAYKQIFYTVTAASPNNPSDLFDDSVTFAELVRKGVSDETPPLMVSNVAYGRTIYVKLETDSKSNDVQTAFKLLLKNPSMQTSGKYKDIYEKSSFTAVVLGGDAQAHNQIVSKDYSVIQEVIKDNAEYSSKNPGYPISYTSVFLKDNSIAAIHNNTEYVETKTTEYSKGKITLDHSGAYVARFEVSWDEFTFDENGQEIITHKTWKDNRKNKTAHYSTVIPIPANAKNIRIFAEECTGLAWDWWRTVIDETDVPLSSDIKASIWGTTLYPKSSITH